MLELFLFLIYVLMYVSNGNRYLKQQTFSLTMAM